jgi:hypothetical protein
MGVNVLLHLQERVVADGYGTACSVAGSFRFPARTAERHFEMSRRPALGAATISVIPFHPPLSEPLARYDIAPESTLKGDGRDDRRGIASTLNSRPQSGLNPGLIPETNGSGIAGPVQGGFQP